MTHTKTVTLSNIYSFIQGFLSQAELILNFTLTLSEDCSVCATLAGPTSCFLSADPSHFLLSSSRCGSNLWEPCWPRKTSVRVRQASRRDIYSWVLTSSSVVDCQIASLEHGLKKVFLRTVTITTTKLYPQCFRGCLYLYCWDCGDIGGVSCSHSHSLKWSMKIFWAAVFLHRYSAVSCLIITPLISN